ncbi:hypothetical protein V2J09_001731 [Rumex salicifolius]
MAANPWSVNSPRRILSLSKKSKSLFTPELDYDFSRVGFSGEHGPKPTEVYGFVGSITTVVAAVIFFLWAYLPDCFLHSIGISYYPSRYWAVALPTYFMVTVVLAVGCYIGLNFIATPPPTSLNVIFDEYSREPQKLLLSEKQEDQPIESISDIGIHEINDMMFGESTIAIVN